MNYLKTLNFNVDIYSVKTELSEDNVWYNSEIFWKSMWFSVRIINLRAREMKYHFTAKWINDFPKKFVVCMNGEKYKPIQSVISDKCNDVITFFAVKDRKGEMI